MTRVGAPGQIGLIETIRARGGRLPWLRRHLDRLHASVEALGVIAPATDLGELIRTEVGPGDRVVRLELREGHAELATRAVTQDRPVSIIVADDVHRPYQHKTTQREPFGRALARARRSGADDAVLLTAAGFVAEGTAWNLFWWDNGSLCTPAEDLGILPGVGRQRVMELTPVKEVHATREALRNRSLFLVNSVRGIVEIGVLDGDRVLPDPRTVERLARFLPGEVT